MPLRVRLESWKRVSTETPSIYVKHIVCHGDSVMSLFFFQAEDGIRDYKVTGVQTCALPILAIEHGQEALGIGGVAGLDDDIEDQTALAGNQVELVTVLHVAAALEDDVGV